MALSPTADDVAELDRILAGGLLRSVYQPIVELERHAVVAWEALARGPENSPLRRPERLFAVARACGRAEELDWACRVAALRGALEGGLRPPHALFVNIEPDLADSPVPPSLRAFLAGARATLRLVVELTEHALTAQPAGTLAAVPFLRTLGVRVALDDVGADPRSLALMPLLRPDLVKLDQRLVQHSPDQELAATVHAVAARAEAAGTLILAEGIETEEHLDRARALGARYGQGWLFGRPGPLPAAGSSPQDAELALPGAATEPRTGATPHEVVEGEVEFRIADAGLLEALARELEHHAAAAGAAGVLLVTSPTAPAPASVARLEHLAEGAAFVGLLSPAPPWPGHERVRSVAVPADDQLAGEWAVLVVSPHLAAALVARPQADGRLRYALTYDRGLVCAAARTVMARIGR